MAGPPVITVITPAYNRVCTLPRVYESLVAQTFKSFEWIVVDDGSEDDTTSLVRNWADDATIEIRYHRQANCGKHVALNRGVEFARGHFTTVVDSDDWISPTAFERMLAVWEGIPPAQRESFSGVVGLTAYEDGRVIGDHYPSEPLDCDPIELAHVYKVRGDKFGMLRTAVWRRFPFPFEHLRGVVTEQLVWNRMGLEFRERHVNEIWGYKEYLEGGLTDRALELQIQAAPATRQLFLEEAGLPRPLPLSHRLRAYGNFVRYSLHAGNGFLEQRRDAPSKLAWAALAPVGFMLYRRDMRATRRKGARDC